jgi:hypothetical protein
LTCTAPRCLSSRTTSIASRRWCAWRARRPAPIRPAPEFLLQDGLPNFLFYVNTAYDILRAQGVPVGKGHFDGFHPYPSN